MRLLTLDIFVLISIAESFRPMKLPFNLLAVSSLMLAIEPLSASCESVGLNMSQSGSASCACFMRVPYAPISCSVLYGSSPSKPMKSMLPPVLL